MSDILISVIVPIYNAEPYLERCLESILNQSYRNLQVILIDDGSTDNSGFICDSYKENDSRIKVIHSERHGLVSARKIGLGIASGCYIGFIDADDYIEQEFYKTLYTILKESDADFVHTGYIKEHNNKKEIFIPFKDAVYDVDDNDMRLSLMKKILSNGDTDTIISPSIWSKLFKADFIKRCYDNVPNENCLGEDLLALTYCVMETKKIILKEIALYHYCIKEGSMTHANNAEIIIDLGIQFKNLKAALLNYGLYDELIPSVESYYINAMINNLSRLKNQNLVIHRYFCNDIDYFKGKEIVLYGAGNVGQDLYAQLCMYPDCKIVAWVDSSYNKYVFDYMKVDSPDIISELNFDVILIAVKNSDLARNIELSLVDKGISKSKIYYGLKKLNRNI